jgi:cystathionine gamma-synthase
LQCPDLEKLRELADEHDFCLVVDDTIGNFLNVDLIESGLADAVCSSLTKLVSGRGDAIAGSVVLNPNTEKGRWMKEDMAKDTDLHGGLFEADARAMVYNSQDFVERNDKINESSEKLADFLNGHPDVETVWYPKLVAPLYPKYQKGGYGGLMSIHLHSHICQRTFYDALDVAKGPSLGTNFTLVCPYTLLAHYHELDFAISYDVPPNLIRIAVGLEDFEELKAKFEAALSKSRLHPKITTPAST